MTVDTGPVAPGTHLWGKESLSLLPLSRTGAAECAGCRTGPSIFIVGVAPQWRDG